MAHNGWRGGAALVYAWGAGAAFVASLLYFAYFYSRTLGRAAPGYMSPPAALLLDLSLFAAFGLHHSVMARTRAKLWFARMVPAELERATFVWVSSVVFILVCAAWQRVPGDVYRVDPPLGWVLTSVQLVGVVLMLQSAARLDMLDLAGIRQVQYAQGKRARSESRLEITGGYRIVRHPIYLAWLLIVFAAPYMTRDRLAFAVISTLYLIIGTPLEERGLEREFGESYREYKRRVRWRFIPGIY